MGIYDRDYNRPYQENYSAIGGGFGSIPPVVKWLLIINLAVFVINGVFFKDLLPQDPKMRFTVIDQYFSVFPISTGYALQLWRVISYQFLHAGIWHIVFNMIVLYMFGPLIERAWGSKAFLKFYLACGASGGILFTLLVMTHLQQPATMVGASGAIYGVMAATVVLYPRMRVLVWGLIPMTMMWLVALAVIFSLINIAAGKNVGGELSHLSGLAIGFAYVLYKPMMTRMRMERKKGAWARKIEHERNFQTEVDRILDKVHREGLQSLTNAEKKILQEATRREQKNA